MSYPATPNQMGFIKNLVTERQHNVGVTDVELFVSTLSEQRITKTGASDLINMLLSMPVDAPEPVVAAPGAAAPAFVRSGPTNRYGGNCVNCGNYVEASTGTYRKGARGNWETLHCAGDPACVKTVGEEYGDIVTFENDITLEDIIAKNLTTKAAWAVVTRAMQDIAFGGFAVPSITGVNDLSFFRIKENKGRINPAKKGEHYFATVVGGRGDGEIAVSPAYIAKALKAIDAASYIDEDGVIYHGREAAERCFGNEIGQCGRCGCQLTSEWRKRGIGPECAKKVGF